jgi:hypothetical protein
MVSHSSARYAPFEPTGRTMPSKRELQSADLQVKIQNSKHEELDPTTQNQIHEGDEKIRFPRKRQTVPLHHSSLDRSVTWPCSLERISKTLLGRDSTPWTIHPRNCGRIAKMGRNEAAASRAVDKAATQPFHRIRIAYRVVLPSNLHQNDANDSPGTRTLSQNPPLRILFIDNIPRSSG